MRNKGDVLSTDVRMHRLSPQRRIGVAVTAGPSGGWNPHCGIVQGEAHSAVDRIAGERSNVVNSAIRQNLPHPLLKHSVVHDEASAERDRTWLSKLIGNGTHQVDNCLRRLIDELTADC